MASHRHDPLIVGVLFTVGGEGWQGSFVVGWGHGGGAGAPQRSDGWVIGNLVVGQLGDKILPVALTVSTLPSIG